MQEARRLVRAARNARVSALTIILAFAFMKYSHILSMVLSNMRVPLICQSVVPNTCGRGQRNGCYVQPGRQLRGPATAIYGGMSGKAKPVAQQIFGGKPMKRTIHQRQGLGNHANSAWSGEWLHSMLIRLRAIQHAVLSAFIACRPHECISNSAHALHYP
eukprot:350149-Chlamydomonas_euryale.AAC.21